MISPFFKKLTLKLFLTVNSSDTFKYKTLTLKLKLTVSPYVYPETVIIGNPQMILVKLKWYPSLSKRFNRGNSLDDFAETAITYCNLLCPRG